MQRIEQRARRKRRNDFELRRNFWTLGGNFFRRPRNCRGGVVGEGVGSAAYRPLEVSSEFTHPLLFQFFVRPFEGGMDSRS